MTAKQMKVEQLKALHHYQSDLKKEQARLTKEHEEFLKRDIVEIYSALAVVMFKNGNSVDSIENLIEQIAEVWSEHVQNSDITMKDYCIQLTGIDLEEKVE